MSATSHRTAGRPREFDIDTALDEAIVVFTERGYHGTSIADLKAAMGLTAGSIYKAFQDKKSIFLAAFDRYKQVRNALLEAELAPLTTGRDKVRGMLHFYAAAACGETGRRGCLAIGAAVELTLFDADVDGRVAATQTRTLEQIRGFIRDGQADGSISSDVDVDTAALAVMAFLQGIRIVGKTSPKPAATHAAADALLRILD